MWVITWGGPLPSGVCRDLQDRLDLLAAALAYYGLTVLSGFSAFDQDQDGRISSSVLGSLIRQYTIVRLSKKLSQQ